MGVLVLLSHFETRSGGSRGLGGWSALLGDGRGMLCVGGVSGGHLVAGQFGEGGVHLVGQGLVAILVEPKFVFRSILNFNIFFRPGS
jgi:hypothetical protein